jgi:hypothetical protein
MTDMQILCWVNQAEAFRRGIDAPRSTIKIEVDPAKLPEDIREFLADHLYDGYKLNSRIELRSPDMFGLMEAVLAVKEYNQAEADDRLPKHSAGYHNSAGLPISFEDWLKGEGKAGSANREKLAKELTEAQKHSPSKAPEKSQNDNLDTLQMAAKGAIELASRKK